MISMTMRCFGSALLTLSVLLSVRPAIAQSLEFANTDLAQLPSASRPISRGTFPAFDPKLYNPAVLHLRYTPAAGKTTDPSFDAFIDLTLISSDQSPEGRRIELNSKRLRTLLRSLYRSLSRQEPISIQDPSSASRQLYELLIAPIAGSLERQSISTLLIAADRGLQAIPFAALTDGRQFFGERYAFSLTPSLALTDFDSSSPTSDSRLLALGASRFEDLSPLPLVPQELKNISSEPRKDQYLNEAFTPSSLTSKAADPQYSYVHVATHAEFVPGGPSKSRLFSGTAPISLDQLSQLRKARKGIPLELIVFSACRTALGDPESELGFAGLALQAGSKSAVGTLWYVDDVVTSAYFVQMYRFLDQGIPKAEALQLTRQALARGVIRLDADQVLGVDGKPLLTGLNSSQKARMQQGVSHPFFWAGIQLLGSPW